MAYNAEIADRVLKMMVGREGLTERKMFGGIAFMLNGNMCFGVTNDDLMVRLGADGLEDALDPPHARPMDFTGRPMKGFVFVDAGAVGDRVLRQWIQRGVTFAESLPAK
jgi:TfoX/Sxy family transcriptional regulator of competence genes